METTKNTRMYFGRPGNFYGFITFVVMIALTAYQIIMSYLVLKQEKDDFAKLLIFFVSYMFIEWIYFIVVGVIKNRQISLEIIAFALSSISLFITASINPSSALTQFASIVLGLFVFIFMIEFMKDTTRTSFMRMPMALAALGLLAITILLASYKNGAKNWIYIGGVSIQPSEFAKIAFVYVGAATLDKLQSTRSLTMYVLFAVACVGLLGLMSDFGAALIYFATFIIMAFMRSGDFRTIIMVCAAALIGGIIILTMRPYILTRFKTYRHIWEYIDEGGFQQTRSLIYAASGGFFGVGIGNGYLRDVFAASEDLVFCLVCEELGMLTGFLVLITIALMALGTAYNARYSRSSFFTIASCAAAGMIIVQTSLNVFGVTDFIPMTGVTLPFISQGGSSMISCWGLLAFIKAADARTYGLSLSHTKERRQLR